MVTHRADVAILGSGFGGSLAALCLASSGISPVLLDKGSHPRFAIGESSTPMANMILRDLADRYALPRIRPLARYGTWQEACPQLVAGRKRGFSYFFHQRDVPFRPDPAHGNELLVAASSDDYHCDTHWLRADVDAFLAEEVQRAGIPFLDDTRMTRIVHDGGWQLTGTRHEEAVHVEAGFLIDATGGAAVVPSMLGLADHSDRCRTRSRAIYAHFDGVSPWGAYLAARADGLADHPFRCDDAALHHVLDGAWMWQLRFNTGRVSAGLVLDLRRYPLDPERSADEEWAAWLAAYPALAEQLAGARCIDPPGGLARTGRLQRRAARIAGPTWALLPHTAGFIDPLHSTGIAHTLSGVERLVSSLSAHLGSPQWEAESLRYEQAVGKELDLIDALIAACYAAMGSPRRFTAATMLYFAAVITYEQARARWHEEARDIPFDRLLLGADDERLVAVVERSLARLAHAPSDDSTFDAAFEQAVESAIVPYNTAGLFHPAVANMYHHTAAPL